MIKETTSARLWIEKAMKQNWFAAMKHFGLKQISLASISNF